MEQASNHRQLPEGQSNLQDLGKREEVEAGVGNKGKLSFQQAISVFSHRLAKRGNAWMATLTPNQQRTLVACFLFGLACYFVVLSGRTFFSDALQEQRGLPQITPMPDPLPGSASQKKPSGGQQGSQSDLPAMEPSDSTATF